MKFALTAFPERYVLPGRPAGSPATADAHKQTQFFLGEELSLFERSMNLQLSVVAANKKARAPGAAALLSFWGRTFTHLADACALMSSGSYVSCPPLIRTALDCLAAQRSLIRDGFQEYEEWFEEAVTQARQHQALSFELGGYRAGSVLAEDEQLGALYRLLTNLSMPHFGSTALQVGPESGPEKLTLAFADSTFHLGWAQLISEWLLSLSVTQIETTIQSGLLVLKDEAHSNAAIVTRESTRLLGDSRRCRVEETDGRFLFHNFRRRSSGQPKRVML
jgi:hypothetical protein